MLGEGGDVLLTQGPSVTRWMWRRLAGDVEEDVAGVDGDGVEAKLLLLRCTCYSGEVSKVKRRAAWFSSTLR